MKSNEYIEYTLINPETKNHQQFVVNDGGDIIQVFNNHLGVENYFEAESYHLEKYAKDNDLKLYSKIKQYTSIEKLLKQHEGDKNAKM